MTMLTLPLFTAPWDRVGDGPPFPLFLVPLFWLVFLAVVVTAIVLSRRHREAGEGRRAGERVLAERFAAGTIDDEEYRLRRAVLREKKQP